MNLFKCTHIYTKRVRERKKEREEERERGRKREGIERKKTRHDAMKMLSM